jgi:hypothetical protein
MTSMGNFVSLVTERIFFSIAYALQTVPDILGKVNRMANDRVHRFHLAEQSLPKTVPLSA